MAKPAQTSSMANMPGMSACSRTSLFGVGFGVGLVSKIEAVEALFLLRMWCPRFGNIRGGCIGHKPGVLEPWCSQCTSYSPHTRDMTAASLPVHLLMSTSRYKLLMVDLG